MNKVTILLGPNGSGKTFTAYKMAEGKKAVILNVRDIKDAGFFWGKLINTDTEIVIVDDVCSSKEVIRTIMAIDRILIDKPRQEPVEIDRPEMVITSNRLTKEDFSYRPWLEIIECNYQPEVNQ